MGMKLILLTTLQVILNIGGIAVLKLGLEKKPLRNLMDYIKLIINWQVVLGVFLIGLGFLVTITILHQAKMSIYQPLSSGITFIVNIAVATWILGERTDWKTLLGILIIMFGIFILSYDAKSTI
jgi:drug/metabolite transporter (DMT)-like permease